MDPEKSSFEFVIHEPNVALSRENRSKIRRHAMRAVGAARLRSVDTTALRLHPLQRHSLHLIPLSGLELLVKDYGLDPMDLSALASVHIGTVASATIQSYPGQLGRVLSCRQRSYLSYIPPRFGHVAALDDAYRCLITVAHSNLVANGEQISDKVLAYYGKALRSLQSAIDNPREHQTAEILCAVSLLALFEILHPSSEQLWSSHIAGASVLVQARGPQGFTSDFDKALITGLCYPISAEALLNNRKCFLDHPAWTETIKQAVDPHETFTDRSPLGIALMLLMAKVPGLAKRTSHAVAMADLQGGHGNEQDIDALTSEVHTLRSKVITWRRDFNMALIHSIDSANTNTSVGNMHSASKRYELLGASLVIHMLADRMLVSLSPPQDPGGRLLEDEVQGLAAELKQAQRSVPLIPGNHRAEFFLDQKAKIADAVIATHADFRRAAARGTGRVTEARVLKGFCEALGRKCCDGKDCCS